MHEALNECVNLAVDRAEKNSDWRGDAKPFSRKRMSLMKPISTMRSTSSSTTML